MKKTITFVKLMDRWFADLPELKDQIDIADCEMVAGADTMCTVLSEGKRFLTITLDTDELTDWNVRLTKVEDNSEYGANYICEVFKNCISSDILYKGELWLCPVTEMIFGNYPQNIYLS